MMILTLILPVFMGISYAQQQCALVKNGEIDPYAIQNTTIPASTTPAPFDCQGYKTQAELEQKCLKTYFIIDSDNRMQCPEDTNGQQLSQEQIDTKTQAYLQCAYCLDRYAYIKELEMKNVQEKNSQIQKSREEKMEQYNEFVSEENELVITDRVKKEQKQWEEDKKNGAPKGNIVYKSLINDPKEKDNCLSGLSVSIGNDGGGKYSYSINKEYGVFVDNTVKADGTRLNDAFDNENIIFRCEPISLCQQESEIKDKDGTITKVGGRYYTANNRPDRAKFPCEIIGGTSQTTRYVTLKDVAIGNDIVTDAQSNTFLSIPDLSDINVAKEVGLIMNNTIDINRFQKIVDTNMPPESYVKAYIQDQILRIYIGSMMGNARGEWLNSHLEADTGKPTSLNTDMIVSLNKNETANASGKYPGPTGLKKALRHTFVDRYLEMCADNGTISYLEGWCKDNLTEAYICRAEDGAIYNQIKSKMDLFMREVNQLQTYNEIGTINSSNIVWPQNIAMFGGSCTDVLQEKNMPSVPINSADGISFKNCKVSDTGAGVEIMYSIPYINFAEEYIYQSLKIKTASAGTWLYIFRKKIEQVGVQSIYQFANDVTITETKDTTNNNGYMPNSQNGITYDIACANTSTCGIELFEYSYAATGTKIGYDITYRPQNNTLSFSSFLQEELKNITSEGSSILKRIQWEGFWKPQSDGDLTIPTQLTQSGKDNQGGTIISSMVLALEIHNLLQKKEAHNFKTSFINAMCPLDSVPPWVSNGDILPGPVRANDDKGIFYIINQFIPGITNAILVFIYGAFVLVILAAGYIYFWSSYSKSQYAETAWNTILYGSIGITLAAMAYAIVKFIIGINFFGA